MRWRIALLAVAVGAAWLPMSPRAIERWYSNGIYPWLQGPITALSNLVSFALFDLLLIVVIAAWLTLCLRDVFARRKKRTRATVGRIAVRTAALAAGLYIAFLVVWGLNYRRVPLIEKLPFDSHAVTTEAARTLAVTAIERLNALYGQAHRDGWPPAGAIDAPLAAAFVRAHHQVGGRGNVRPGRPKQSLLDSCTSAEPPCPA